ncbi:MAG: hypothetical protein GXX94_09785 [Chloroflexi bacterium]|nr:hypothetical protein [Chloroflexota bacterium]
MSSTEKACSANCWQPVGPIVDGGTVFAVGISLREDVPGYWAATGAGIYSSMDGGTTWVQNLNGLTSPLISGLTVARNGALYAGSLNADLYVSLDYGKSWQRGKPSWDVDGSVTGMATSPNSLTDGVAFVTLDGGALMATRDNGKTWEDASFGLNSMQVFAIAVSPDWTQYETMWASTQEGVYISRNGARAWRATGLADEDDVVDALAASPDFANDSTVYAGTEGGALHISRDGGRRWSLLQEQIGEGPVYCLWLSPDFGESGRMLAGVGSDMYLSLDRGGSWARTAQLPGSILSVSGDEHVVLAGLHNAGVWKSTDAGESWSATGSLVARGFARLAASEGTLYAMGPQEGIFVSSDNGQTWAEMEGLDEYLPIATMQVGAGETLFVASHEAGILQIASSRRSWRVRADQPEVSALLVLPERGLGWAGTSDGKYLVSKDGGKTWTQSDSGPSRTQRVLTIVASPSFSEDHTLYVGTAIEATRRTKGRVVLWRSRNEGKTWHQVTTQETESRWMDITMPAGITERVADQAVIATGPFCLRPLRKAKDVWISTAVDPAGANVLSVVAIGEIDSGGALYAATGNGIYHSADGGRTWQPFSEGVEGLSFVAMTLVAEGESRRLYALSLGGMLYTRDIA